MKKTIPVTNNLYPRTVRMAELCLLLLLALVPFHAFLTVWFSSFGISYTILRLWSVIPLALLGGAFLYWWWRDQALRSRLKGSFLVRATAVYIVLSIVLGLRGLFLGTVGLEAFLIGLFLNLRFLVLFIVIIALMRYTDKNVSYWLKYFFISALVVGAFAVLQYAALPKDFLSHFGYGPSTIEPYETINNNSQYVRVISTLRGANPLGAYMVIVITFIVALWRKLRPRLAWWIWLAVSVGALTFSFSRSAWLGVLVGIMIIIAFRFRLQRNWRKALVILITAHLVMFTLIGLLSKTHFVQNMLYHTDDSSTTAVSSNDQRASGLKQGLTDVVHQPLGSGLGSAGPASVHNTKSANRFAENYFLQIGQEIGWFGLIVLMMLFVAVGFQLWQQRSDPVAMGLLASFAGLFIVNMLSHAWADDTLAYTWWGLAGIVIGQHIWRQDIKN